MPQESTNAPVKSQQHSSVTRETISNSVKRKLNFDSNSNSSSSSSNNNEKEKNEKSENPWLT